MLSNDDVKDLMELIEIIDDYAKKIDKNENANHIRETVKVIVEILDPPNISVEKMF